MKPKKKIQNHLFSIKEEMEKCKNDPFYFYEKYWLKYAMNDNVSDKDRMFLELYWSSYQS